MDESLDIIDNEMRGTIGFKLSKKVKNKLKRGGVGGNISKP